MTLSAFAWNIVRTYTLTPGRRSSFGCRYRLGTDSNLVMFVSAADNDYRVGLSNGPAGGLAGPHGLGHAGRAHRAGQRGLRPAAVRRELHQRVHASGAVSCAALTATGTVAGATLTPRRVSGHAHGIAATAASFAATSTLTGATLTITGAAGLREPGLHLHGHAEKCRRDVTSWGTVSALFASNTLIVTNTSSF